MWREERHMMLDACTWRSLHVVQRFHSPAECCKPSFKVETQCKFVANRAAINLEVVRREQK